MTTVAELRWQWALEQAEQPTSSREEYNSTVAAFFAQNAATHHCLFAVRDDAVVGMAWLAVLPRIPSPGAQQRVCGDLQSVYVIASERSAGIGAVMVAAILKRAAALGLEHVTVHSSPDAVRMYARNGFGMTPRLMYAEPAIS